MPAPAERPRPTRRPAYLAAVVVLAGVAVAAGAYLAPALFGRSASRQDLPAPAAEAVVIGGPFQLSDEEGKPISEKAFLGKPTAMFFGYTFCPDVCPTTLAELAAAMKELGPDADRLNVVFVSVDWDRDKPEMLRDYVASFDPRIRGLSGSQQQIEDVARAYRVYFKRVQQPGGDYLIDHSASVYLFDATGYFVQTIAYDDDQATRVAKLRSLLAAS